MALLRGFFLCLVLTSLLLTGTCSYTYGQTPEEQPSKTETDLEVAPAEELRMQERMREWMRGQEKTSRPDPRMESAMGGEAEMMKRMMEHLLPPRGVPFYREKTFLALVIAAFVLAAVLLMKRWGLHASKVYRKRAAFVNEAILVVDLCESTKLAVTQGDAFAMRITNKMKECVRDVAETFRANFFQSTGDGYLITFPVAADAVKAAIRILQNAAGYNLEAPKNEKIELRVGIGYGELVLDEEGGRHGAAINKAFRIEGLRKEDREKLSGGMSPEDFPEKNRIFLSEELKEEIHGLPGIQTQFVGVFNLKGFTGLHRIYHIPWEDLPREA